MQAEPALFEDMWESLQVVIVERPSGAIRLVTIALDSA